MSRYRAVYSENFPVRSVYDSIEIVWQEKRHETYRFVTRSPGGEVVGHVAVYHSMPPVPNSNLYEIEKYPSGVPFVTILSGEPGPYLRNTRSG